jgi:MoaA/NifB/PqqE/SkfB family radical SAM enzyme
MLLDYRLEAMEYDPDDFHLEHPLIVWIELTRACNCSCLHCYISAGEPRKRELKTEQIFQLISDLNAKDVFYVALTGGEPLLRKDLLEIIKYACNFDSTVSLLTNGTLLTEEFIRQLPKKNFVVSVSLDGFLTSAKLRGSEADAEKIKRNLLLLKEHGIAMGVMSIMTKVNHHELVQ